MLICCPLEIHEIVIQLADASVVKFYKPPLNPWPEGILEAPSHPELYSRDFHSHHTTWKHCQYDQKGEMLIEWPEKCDLQLVIDVNDRCTFNSGAWNREYNPDLTLAFTDNTGQHSISSVCSS